MTPGEQLVDKAHRLGVRLEATTDGKLRVHAPPGVVTTELRAALADAKFEVLALLGQERHDRRGPTAPAAQGPSWTLVATDADAATACKQLATETELALDVETYGVTSDKKAALNPFTNRVRLVQLGTPTGRVIIFDLLKLGGMPEPLRTVLTGDRQLVGYNLAFDVKCLLHHFGVEPRQPVDLYAAAVLVDGYLGHNEKGCYTLKASAHRYLGIDLDKTQATSDWGIERLSSEQLEYAAMDVRVLPKLHRRLQSVAREQGVAKAWAIENGVLVPLAALELTGIGVDGVALENLRGHVVANLDQARVRALGLLGRDLNLNSNPQLKQALEEATGIHLASTKEVELKTKLGHLEVGQAVLDYRQHQKLVQFSTKLGTLVGNDGRVRAHFHSLGATTGRMSCSGPNLQQMPRDERFRSIFAAAAGKVFVVADYAAVELRVAAALIRDPELLRCFRDGIDPHCRTAAFILHKELKAVTKEERQRAKAINFGFCFGMGAKRFVEYAKKSYGVPLTEEEAREAKRQYMALYQGIAAWHRRAEPEGRRTMAVRTASGRLRKFREFKFNEYLNTPVQGTAADGLKRALALLHPRLKPLGARLVNVIHDEVVVEVPQDRAAEALEVAVAAMKEGMAEFLGDVPVGVEAHLAPRWTKG